jgi:hypothetical protein
MDALELAWQDESQDSSYYLDIDTGNVELVQQGLYDLRDLTDEIERDRERYLYIPKANPNQLKQDLADFIATVTEPQLARLLPVALESPNALFACKSVLSKYPTEVERWEDFRKSRLRIRIKQWLSANFIDRNDRKDETEEQVDFSPGN